MIKLESNFLETFNELDNLYANVNESLTQEIKYTYDELSSKYGQNFEELIYGPNGFMAEQYPEGFPDFDGDIIYSEKYWQEFVRWLDNIKHIQLQPETDTLVDFINEADKDTLNEDIQDTNAFLAKYGFDEGIDELEAAGYKVASDINIEKLDETTGDISITLKLDTPIFDLNWEDIDINDEVDEDRLKENITYDIETAFEYTDVDFIWQASVEDDSIDILIEDFKITRQAEYRDSEGQWLPAEAELEGTATAEHPILVKLSRLAIR